MATALITGASSGIGLELARLFARDKHDLVLVARGKAKLEELGASLAREHGIRASVIPADLREPDAPTELVETLGQAGLVVDILVNDAGYGTYGPFAAADLGESLGMLQVNVVALTHLTGLLLPGMRERHRGRILNVASTAAFQPGPLMAVYYASKAYVLHFSEAIAEELRGTGVTVTTLCPGPTRTDFQRRARMEDSRLMRNPFVMDAATVARAGYDGLMRGKRVVVPGVMNNLLRQTVRVSPRVLTARIAGALNARAG